MNKEQEKLVLTNYEWDLLIKKLSSILSKARIIQEGRDSKIKKSKEITQKALECLDLIKYKKI
jgi:hypothetical protein